MSIIITGPFDLECFDCGKTLDAQIDLDGNPGEATKQAIRVKMCEDCDESMAWEERALKAERALHERDPDYVDPDHYHDC
jgi:hypothetical protein